MLLSYLVLISDWPRCVASVSSFKLAFVNFDMSPLFFEYFLFSKIIFPSLYCNFPTPNLEWY